MLSLRRLTKLLAVVVSYAAFFCCLSGCAKVAWWTGKTVVKHETEELKEKTGISKTKDELREEIKQSKQSCDRDVAVIEKKMAAQKEECAAREADLKKQIKELRESYEEKQAELERALEQSQ